MCLSSFLARSAHLWFLCTLRPSILGCVEGVLVPLMFTPPRPVLGKTLLGPHTVQRGTLSPTPSEVGVTVVWCWGLAELTNGTWGSSHGTFCFPCLFNHTQGFWARRVMLSHPPLRRGLKNKQFWGWECETLCMIEGDLCPTNAELTPPPHLLSGEGVIYGGPVPLILGLCLSMAFSFQGY